MERLKWWMGMLVAAVVWGAGTALAGQEMATARGMQKLVFDANGGTCNTGYDYYTQGEPYTFLPEAVWSGHEFLGWFTAASGGMQVTEAQTVTAVAERTLYAHWAEAQGASAVVNGVTWRYSVANGKATVTGAEPAVGDLTIPATLAGYPVTRIGAETWEGDGAFEWCTGLTSVTIPSSVPLIGYRAFVHCTGLKSVSIPDGVTFIGPEAFDGCIGLTTMALPASVTLIGDTAFDGCSGLKTLYVPAAWKGTDILVDVLIPGGCTVVYGLPSSQLELAGTERSFTADAANGKLVGVTANVPWTAAANVSWLTVTTASGTGNGNLTYNVAANTGTGSRTGIITVSGGGITRTYTVTQDGPQQVVVFDGAGGTPDVACRTNAIGLAYGPFPSATWEGHTFLGWSSHREGGTEVLATDIVPAWSPRTLFAHWSEIPSPQAASVVVNGVTWRYSVANGKATVTGAEPAVGDLTIPATLAGYPVTRIGAETWEGDGAFEWCTGLTSVTIPSSVPLIGYRAFVHCTGLKSVSIPDGVTFIGPEAFDGCIGLTTMALPASVTLIGDTAFDGCSGLKTLYVPAAWKGTDILVDVLIPGGCTVVYGLPSSQLELAGTERSFTADAANGKLVGVTANVPWTAAANVSWLTVTTASGTGNGNLTYNVAANTGTGSRTGIITVSGGGITRTYTVTQDGPQQVVVFDGAGGTPDVACRTNAIGLAYGPLPSATWAGHALLGWFSHRVGGTEVLATDIVPAWTPRTLFAHWTTEQTVVFDANGGTTPEAQRTRTIGAAYGTLPAATRSGYLLLGWYTAVDGGTAVAAGNTVTAEATRTLYAHWKLSETRTTPVAVPSVWLDAHGFAQDSDQGYEAAANGTAANGMKVWECYVAGLDPAGTTEFTVKSISVVDGVPRVEWNPDLNKGGTKTERSYRLLGKKNLGDKDWTDVTDVPNPGAADWRFFRVRVAMPTKR